MVVPFNAPVKEFNIKLNGNSIPVHEAASHLGTIIGKNNVHDNLNTAISNLLYRTNILMSRYSYCSSDVLLCLFESYRTSFYGCPLWDLSCKGIRDLQVAWENV